MQENNPNTILHLDNPFDGCNAFSDKYIRQIVDTANSALSYKNIQKPAVLKPAATPVKPKQDVSRGKSLLSTVLIFVCVFALIVLVRFTGILNSNKVEGVSMEPNYHTGNIVLTTKLTPIKRYDVVTATTPTGVQVIKRVIGLPGDSITVTNGHIYVNGAKTSEKFVLDKKYNEDSDPEGYFLEKNQYFLAGDNRMNSTDSRAYGPVTKDEIHGEVILRIPIRLPGGNDAN